MDLPNHFIFLQGRIYSLFQEGGDNDYAIIIIYLYITAFPYICC